MKKLPEIAFDDLRNKLKIKHLQESSRLKKQFPKAHDFIQKRNIDFSAIRNQSAKLLSTGMISGALFLNAPIDMKSLPLPSQLIEKVSTKNDVIKKNEMIYDNSYISDVIKNVLPEITRPLYRNEEKFLEQVIRDSTGIPVRASLEGEHLNTVYGKIGKEQHLKRYPGDSIEDHGQVLGAGIAPGLGAWGYFAHQKSELTPELIEIEKWYAVVPTLYLPDWNTRQPYLKDWYRYRKVMIINTVNGRSVICSIADSGPAAWTGKHFGGSPEVMEYLGGEKYTKGPVLVFFVDDPENRVALGPVALENNPINTNNPIK